MSVVVFKTKINNNNINNNINNNNIQHLYSALYNLSEGYSNALHNK